MESGWPDSAGWRVWVEEDRDNLEEILVLSDVPQTAAKKLLEISSSVVTMGNLDFGAELCFSAPNSRGKLVFGADIKANADEP